MAFEFIQPLFEFVADVGHCPLDAIFRHHKVPGRVEIHFVTLASDFPTDWMDHSQRVDLVTPKLNPHCKLVVRRPDVDRITTHTEAAAVQRDVTSLVLNGDQLLEQVVTTGGHAGGEANHHRLVVLG